MRGQFCATRIIGLAAAVLTLGFAVHGQEAVSPESSNLPYSRDLDLASAARISELTLAAAERLATTADPRTERGQALASALNERAVAAESWPDPTLKMGIMSLPVDTFDLEQEAMTQVQVGIRQMFPRSGSLEHGAERLRAKARAHAEEASTQTRHALRAVRMDWAELFYWERAAEVVVKNLGLFKQMVTIATSLYSTGRSNQQDILRAEVELGLLEDRLVRIRQMQQQARARLSKWVGATQAALPLPREFPRADGMADLARLRLNLAEHPLVLAQSAMVQAGQLGVALSKDQYNSQWSLDVTYGYRPGSAMDGSPWADFVSVGVMVDLPFFTSNRQDRNVQASLEEVRAASRYRDEVLRELERQLAEQHAAWLRLGDRLSLYDQKLIALVRDNSEASLRAYQNDVTDFATLTRARITELETQLRWWRLHVDRAQVRAKISFLTGEKS